MKDFSLEKLVDFGTKYQPVLNQISEKQAELASITLTPEETALLSQESELLTLKKEIDEKEASVLSLQRIIAETEKTYKDSEALETKLQKLLTFYNETLEDFTSQYLSTLSGLITNIYQTLYQNFDKTVRLEVEDSRGKKVIALYTDRVFEGKVYPEDLSDASGSERCMIGLMIDIYYILVTGQPRVMFIDEVFEYLHDDVLGRTLTFLQSFVDRFGFEFLIIDHRYNVVKKYATRIYSIENGEVSEI